MAVANFLAVVMENRFAAIIESIVQEKNSEPTNLATFGRPEISPF